MNIVDSVGRLFGGDGDIAKERNPIFFLREKRGTRRGVHQFPFVEKLRSAPRFPENLQLLHFFISTAESALAGIAARVPAGSAPELAHKRTEPRPSCRACGTYPRGRNAPGNNLPIRHAPTPRR